MKFWPDRWKPAKQADAPKRQPIAARSGFFSTDAPLVAGRTKESFDAYMQENAFTIKPGRNFHVQTIAADGKHSAMDSFDDVGIKDVFSLGQSRISPLLGAWYVSQGFIGYQTCALLAQQWLVDKACTQAPKDAARNGYKLTALGGDDLDADTLSQIRTADRRLKVAKNIVEFARFNRIFGIRIALFDVRSDDPDYYEKPFNLDGVRPRSYKGISQIDPYWMVPELDWAAAANPASREFYEPTWWVVSGKRYHHSHLVIIRGPDVPDVLKPSYLFGGLPLTQRIYERVYAAERTANEAPQLALSKRTTFIKTDTAKALANQELFEQRLRYFTDMRDNFGLGVIGEKEDPTQFETSLADLDSVIMTQYQLVAAIAATPATKLLGTSPKGFNATGEYDETSYHEELESIQSHEMTPLLERHYQLLIRSEIAPAAPFEVEIVWNKLDAMTGKERAELEASKATSAQIYHDIGAIDSNDVRSRLAADPDSGFAGLSMDVMPEPDDDTTPLATDDDEITPSPAINTALQNLTGRQFQQISRVINSVGKGKTGKAQAAVMLRGGYGLSEAEIEALLS